MGRLFNYFRRFAPLPRHKTGHFEDIEAMVVVMKLKYVDELSGGRKRFRRRYPKEIKGVVSETFFQVSMNARDGSALVAEHETLLPQYEQIVSKARRKASRQGQLSPLEHWREAVKEVEELVASVIGPEDEDERP